jgi:predicted ATP-dependent serine protease
MQVDVTTRMGALTPATPTALPTLDRLLAGGLRTGTLMAISGPPGAGRTAFVLLLAYIAARSKAAVLFSSVSLDETEIMARLSARALHREYPESRTPYGSIWSGDAFQDDATRRPVSVAIDTVVKKVGSMLHLHRARPFESTTVLLTLAAQLWERHERVVMVVDDIEAFSAGGDSRADFNAGFESRITHVAFELRQAAEQGCAVVVTALERHADLVAPAATLAATIRTRPSSAAPFDDRQLALGARPVELVIKKNRVGPTGIVPLHFIPGAAVFEERAP